MSKIRSSTGCWTCRLRRKKCDELKPACYRCSKLGLDCEGYSERPAWMDRGEQEKLKAEHTKRQVQRSLSFGSKRRATDQSLDEVVTSESVPTSSSPKSFRPNEDGTNLPCPDDTTNVSDDGSELPFRNHDFDLEKSFRCPETTLKLHLEPLQVDFGPRYNIPKSASHEVDDDTWKRAILEQERSGIITTGSLDSYNLPWTNEHQDSSSWSQYPTHSEVSAECCHSRSSTRPSTAEEADLLLYYFTVVCEKQFHLESNSKGWLYLATTRTNIAYWATLSVASHHQGSDSTSYNNLALLELRENMSLLDFKPIRRFDMFLECCFAIVQLMFLEKLRGNLEACKMHRSAANTLFADFQTTKDDLLELTMIASGTGSINSAILQLVIVNLRWFDVLLGCSVRTLPSMSVPLLDILERNSKNIVNRVRCQSQVAAILAQVLELDHWKTITLTAGRLSVVELVNRAATIEKQILADSDVDYTVVEIPASTNLEYKGGMNSQILKIFRSTAIVYLQVIVAGAHRDVPEISRWVSNTVGLFRGLPKAETFPDLAWPFCVIGCLATGEDRVFMAELADDAMLKTSCAMSVKWSSVIIKECWRLLDEGVLIDPDWTSAMKSLGCELMLL
ncbi:uncharacterized protein LY89DRAFT_750569 [Mollisia scopiformis]|uniref:Zn(2)-C6 fungal-type domain-containing protein n=1 Tax=Mollisia scopiformis TaxID=149040 RepID=A0A194X612_MOLSC|nr:uncharacterized protein LY89DRAFT_750569 [Mollisia scopiformis]KUJ15242.1 hypothetical protein LY89DRAFT_750569 [Mollisia scopiformis]